MNPRAFLYLLALALAVMAGPAHAADLFTIPDGDLTKKLFIDALFGPIEPGGGGTSGLTGPITVFNSILLFVGGILAAYTIIAGTMATAHDGEMMGKKWSSMWIPVRTAIGTAAILPALNGWCVAQAIVLWIGMQGVGAADAVWSQFASNPNQGVQFSAPNIVPQVTKLARSMLMSNVCVESFNKSIQDSINAPTTTVTGISVDMNSVYQGLTLSAQKVDNGKVFGYNYTATGGNLLQMANICGGVTMPIKGNPAPLSGDMVTSSAEALNNMPRVQANLEAVHKAALVAMQSVLQPVAAQIAQGNLPDAATLNGAINLAAQAYAQAVQVAASSAFTTASANQTSTNMTKDGWAGAGSWYMTLAQSQDEVATAMDDVPAGTGALDTTKMQLIAFFMQRVQTNLDKTQMLLDDGAALSDNGVNAESHSNSEWLDKMFSWFVEDKHLGFGSDSGALVGQNPVIAAKNLGNKMVTSAWAALGAGTAAAAGAGVATGNVAGKLSGADNAYQSALKLLATPFFTLFAMLLGGGIMLSVVLPMMPYMMWVGVLIGWLILLTESIIAAPLWAVVHMHPDGEAVGKGSTGYMLVLSLALRPPLAVLGFICAVELMTPIGTFINSTIAATANLNVFSNGGGGITALLALMVLYGVFMFHVIKKVFSLIHVIPDSVLKWIGGGVDNLMGTGAKLGENSQGAGAIVVAGMKSFTPAAAEAFGKSLRKQPPPGDDGGAGGGALIERGGIPATERPDDEGETGGGEGGKADDEGAGGGGGLGAKGGKAGTDGGTGEGTGTLSTARKLAGGAMGQGQGGTPRTGTGKAVSGELLDHGRAPYKHDPDENPSYFARVQDEHGREREVWGQDLERAITDSGAKLGDRVTLEQTGQNEAVEVDKTVRDDEGKVTGRERGAATRKGWTASVHGADNAGGDAEA